MKKKMVTKKAKAIRGTGLTEKFAPGERCPNRECDEPLDFGFVEQLHLDGEADCPKCGETVTLNDLEDGTPDSGDSKWGADEDD